MFGAAVVALTASDAGTAVGLSAGFTGVCVVWLFGVALVGASTNCSTLSCVMDSNDLAFAAVVQVLALQSVIGFCAPAGRAWIRPVDVALSLGTGLAPYSVAGNLHNYLALALFMLRVFRGISRTSLGFVYVLCLQAARVLGVVFLHGYGCQNVLPEFCDYATWATLSPPVALWVQLGFVLTGIVSIVFVDGGRPARRWQGVPFLATAALSAGFALYGLARGKWLGSALFATAVAFDAYIAHRLLRKNLE